MPPTRSPIPAFFRTPLADNVRFWYADYWAEAVLGTTIEKGILPAARRQPPSKGSNMKNHHSMSPVSRPRGFTLVELLVVITIIGILVGLTIPAVIYVRIIGKQAAVTLDLKQLEMACQAYKEKFGKYPPDGTNRSAVLRHLAKAFPRFMIAGADDIEKWDNLRAWIQDSSRWGASVDINTLSPFNALTFWLGGRPANGQLTGFSANPADPFDASTSRIGPFFDFDLNRLHATTGRYWPQGAVGNMTTGAIAYFRAENGNYTVDGSDCTIRDASGNITGTDFSRIKCIPDNIESLPAATTYELVLPAADWRIANTPPYSWVNSKSFQIFSAGLLADASYALVPGGTNREPLQYPTGDNYQEQTYDDITNFSGGTLENAMP